MPFDPEAFMNDTIDKPLETDRKLIPPGEYKMMIDDFEAAKAIENVEFEYKKGDRAGTPGNMYTFNCPCVIQDSETLKQELGLDKLTVYKRMILDLDPTTFKLLWGPNKNTDLGQLRKAVGQNDEGMVWAVARLRGAGPFMGRVESKTGKRKDGTAFESREVGRVAPIR